VIGYVGWIDRGWEGGSGMGMVGSVKGLKLAELPVLVGSVRQVAANDEGDALFGQLLLGDRKWVPVHVGNVIRIQIQGCILGDLYGTDSDDLSLFELGHEGRGDPLRVGVFGHVGLLQDLVVILRFLTGLILLLFLLLLVGTHCGHAFRLLAGVVLRAFGVVGKALLGFVLETLRAFVVTAVVVALHVDNL
jgi:hypothetical protein